MHLTCYSLATITPPPIASECKMLSISRDKAMELANLVLIAAKHYEEFRERMNLGTHHEWSFPEFIDGSTERNFDQNTPCYDPLSGQGTKYRVLKQFWHTDRPMSSALLETVPFGFIVEKISEVQLDSSTNQEIYIVFRGTLNSQEWRSNSRYRKEQAVKGLEGEGHVHHGFNSIFETSFKQRLVSLRGFVTRLAIFVRLKKYPPSERLDSIRRSLESTVFNSEIVKDNARIYITGHSLGGALALLAGRVIANEGRLCTAEGREGDTNPYSERLAICSFGSPRTGDVGFTKAFEDIKIGRAHV